MASWRRLWRPSLLLTLLVAGCLGVVTLALFGIEHGRLPHGSGEVWNWVFGWRGR